MAVMVKARLLNLLNPVHQILFFSRAEPAGQEFGTEKVVFKPA